jgi:hypothetical protein
MSHGTEVVRRSRCARGLRHRSLCFCVGRDLCGEPGNSVTIVSGYGLDDRTIEVRPPAEAKAFLL